MCHHTRIVSIHTNVVWVSTMTDTVLNDGIVIEETMIILVVDMNIDIETETYRGAGLAAGQLTPTGRFAQISVEIIHTVAHAVPVIVATGEMNEIAAIDLTEVEIPAAGLTHSKLQLPDVCVSVSRILIVCGQVDTIRATTLAGRGRLRHLLAMAQRHH